MWWHLGHVHNQCWFLACVSSAACDDTGEHSTTRLCLQWLFDRRDKIQGAHVMDYGIGSGVLAVAALLMGAASAVSKQHFWAFAQLLKFISPGFDVKRFWILFVWFFCFSQPPLAAWTWKSISSLWEDTKKSHMSFNLHVVWIWSRMLQWRIAAFSIADCRVQVVLVPCNAGLLMSLLFISMAACKRTMTSA